MKQQKKWKAFYKKDDHSYLQIIVKFYFCIVPVNLNKKALTCSLVQNKAISIKDADTLKEEK